MLESMADGPSLKKRKLEEPVDSPTEGKMNVVLALCGSFNPPTLQHLRLFGRHRIMSTN